MWPILYSELDRRQDKCRSVRPSDAFTFINHLFMGKQNPGFGTRQINDLPGS
jgi:hypothetical protein